MWSSHTLEGCQCGLHCHNHGPLVPTAVHCHDKASPQLQLCMHAYAVLITIGQPGIIPGFALVNPERRRLFFFFLITVLTSLTVLPGFPLHMHHTGAVNKYRQGEAGDHFYVSQSGQFKATKHDGSADKLLFTYHDEGAFGELALMYNCPRAATVTVRGSAMA